MDSRTTSLPAWRNNRERSTALRPARLALVIPTLREAKNIEPLLRRVRIALDSCAVAYEVIVVDDDSRDGTEEILANLSVEDSRLRLIVRHGERGLAGAVLRGWGETEAKYLAVMDADLPHPPELLANLWTEMEAGADLAIGSRYASGGSLGGWKTSRHLISRMAIWMTLPVQRSGLRARDPMSGFFMVRRECLNGIALQTSGFKILLEILARAHLRSVAEVPFTFGRRGAGASKASPRVAFDYLRLLQRLYRQKGRTPSHAEREQARLALEEQREVVRN
jgi:dolichol-phosphate mannosyltransferase